jgi:uncharacterized protein (DUF885 family)
MPMRQGRLVGFALLLAGCAARTAAPTPADPAARVTRLADEYVAEYFRRAPEAATRRGLAGDHGRVIDNSLAAVAEWRRREDAWLREINGVDSTALIGTPAWITYGVLREMLEDSVATRVCRNELWSLNTNVAGWQSSYTSLSALQPVGSDSLRAAAIARIRGLPRFLRTEQANLREGLHQGYVAPRSTVEAIVRQVDGILAAPADSSPFASPAARDTTPGFREAYLRAVAGELLPAIGEYRRFLATEYLPHARSAIGLSANPNGAVCYEASVRRFSTLSITPGEVFRVGEQHLARVEAEMQMLARRAFGTGDVPALLHRLREDTAWTFRTRGEIVDRSNEAIARAKAAMPRWFGRLPKADVVIVEYPEFRQRAGAVPSYTAPSEDGRRPGIFNITTWPPERISRAGLEVAAFHEAIPGHHLQTAIAQERLDAHPITRFFNFSGFSEGWALYTERLADEMGLYSGDVDRMGMLAAESWRAARLVVDAGIHSRGWTRAQAVEFLTAHTTIAPSTAEGEVDRYISWPGQATAYLLGSLTIHELRQKAEARLGGRFDIREFHDQLLGAGTITLPMLQERMERWVEEHP